MASEGFSASTLRLPNSASHYQENIISKEITAASFTNESEGNSGNRKSG